MYLKRYGQGNCIVLYAYSEVLQMKISRIIKLFVLSLLSVSIVLTCGCGKDDKKGADSGASFTPSVTDDIFSTNDVKYLSENGESVYRIIRQDGDETSTANALVVYKQLKSILNVNIKNMSDIEDGNDVYEILVGETNRPETALAKDYLIENAGGRIQDYIICTIGKKIVIFGMTSDALQAACEYFINNYIKTEGVAGGIKYVNITEGNFVDSSINGAKLGNFRFVKQRYNESYLTCSEIDRAKAMIVEKTGSVMSITEDHLSASEYEVIVGDANREGVEKITDKDMYKITVSGKKVFLNGGSPYATAMAVSEFAKKVSAGSLTDADSMTGSYAQTVAGYDTSNYYTPKWFDDFDEFSSTHATGIDMTKWEFGTDSAEGHNGRTSVRSQSPDHLIINEGMLNFHAAFDDTKYYGFKLTTKSTMTFKYGILEMSAILPHGDAFWISLWANSYDPTAHSAFFTEVNVVEMFGNSSSEASNLHGWLKSGMRPYYDSYWKPQDVPEHWSLDGDFSSDKRYACPGGKFNDGLHTFSYIWDDTVCAFACDGNVYFSINPNDKELWAETFNQPIYLILSQATCFATGSGTNLPDDAPEWNSSNNFQIDYVHVYQKDDGKSTLNLDPLNS